MAKWLQKWLYNGALLLLLILYLPKMLWARFYKKKYRQNFKSRFGFKKLLIPSLKEPVIWIHAVSLGEAKASKAFVLEAKKAYPEATLVFSCTTETGFEEVKTSMPFISHLFFLPFDFSWVMKSLVYQIKPQLVVFVEGDLWLNFLQAVKDYGAKTLLINGRISDRSFSRYLYFQGYAKWVFSKLDYCLLQNDHYLNLFLRLGVPLSKLAVTGNMKFDIPSQVLSEDGLNHLKEALGISIAEKVITIGSTHPEEERLLLSILQPLLKENPSLKILLVPRHPERFLEVEKELIRDNIPFCKWSNHMQQPCREKIILIDAMGMLRQCYQISHVAIIGGSFVDIGGHNLLEPLEYGVPVVFGPYIYKQKELSDLMQAAKIGFEIEIEKLAETVLKLINIDNISLQAKAFLQVHHGASLRSWELAQKLLKEIT